MDPTTDTTQCNTVATRSLLTKKNLPLFLSPFISLTLPLFYQNFFTFLYFFLNFLCLSPLQSIFGCWLGFTVEIGFEIGFLGLGYNGLLWTGVGLVFQWCGSALGWWVHRVLPLASHIDAAHITVFTCVQMVCCNGHM